MRSSAKMLLVTNPVKQEEREVMSEAEQLVRFLCVEVKAGESQEKLKAKVLKTISNSEKTTPIPASDPLQTWNEEAHTLLGLVAEDVVKVASNSSYVTFLLRNGRVCRLKMSSREDSNSNKTFTSLDALRRSGTAFHQGSRASFQVLGDEEYAQQLQNELNANTSNIMGPDWSQNRNIPRMSIPGSSIVSDVEGIIGEQLADSDQSPFFAPPPFFDTSFFHDGGTDDHFPTRWSSTTYSGLGVAGARGTQPSRVLDITASQPTMDRRGGAKQNNKKMRLWPEVGSLEWPVMKQNPEGQTTPELSFVAMVAMHSEVLLVTAEDRTLYNWSCAAHTSPKPHPLIKELGLEGERVLLVESSDIRATVVTESGKIATFYDKLLRVHTGTADSNPPSLVRSLTHRARFFPELEKDLVTSLSVSSFLTSAITSSGRVFWWGLCPPTKNNSSDHTHRSSTSSRGVITDGSLVRLRNGPHCGPNSIVFNESGLRPRVGKTMNIIEHSGLDPKMSILVKVFKDSQPCISKPGGTSVSASSGRGLHGPTLANNEDSELQYEGLEVWSLSNVVFLDDSPAVLGRVVTVDQLQAIVDISHASSESGTMGSTSTAPSTLKVFKVSEIEPCMDSHLTSGPSRDSSTRNISSRSDGPREKDRTPTHEGGKDDRQDSVVSQHIAGLVQHIPLCLLTPSLPNSSSKGHHSSTTQPESDSGHSRSVCVYGHRPLAVKMTDNGPMMLVKRISDGSAYLACSGHSDFLSFCSSSFVSVSSRMSKLGRCTIAEESVSAVDGGYERVKHPHAGSCEGIPYLPSLLMLHKSQAMMLQDANGHISSLSEGLRLKSSFSGQLHSKNQPLMPYKCIVTRTYLVRKDTTVMVVVVVPQKQRLVPSVLSGNVATVNSILNQFTAISNRPDLSDEKSTANIPNSTLSEHTRSQEARKTPEPARVSERSALPSPHASRPRNDDDSDSSMPPVKKVRILDSPHSNSSTDQPSTDNHLFSETSLSDQSVALKSLSSAEVETVNFDDELSIIVVGSTCGEGVDGGWRGNVPMEVEGGCDVDILYEVAAHNSNILHVCGQLEAVGENKERNGGVLKAAGGAVSKYSATVQDKCFEELRLDYMNKNTDSLDHWKVEGSGLFSRRFWVLERMLSCLEIEEVVIDLLCQRNREGHTPFLSAIYHQNYAAALKMLKFIEQHTKSRPSLFQDSVPKCCSNGFSALHLLLASLAPNFDSHAMVLYVSSFQLTTAQQLLKLFQVRYPSAYKAELVKNIAEGSDRSSGSSEGSGTEGNHVEEVVGNARSLGRVRRQYRRLANRRLTRNHDNALSTPSQSGRVYFSDVMELRAAAREMQGFCVVSNVFRNTGFSTTQTISYLNLGLEPASLDSTDDREDLPYIIEPERLLDPGTLYSNLRDNLTAYSRRKCGSHTANKNSQLSNLELTHQLLVSFLSHPSLVSSLDKAGETPLASAIHNPRCIERLMSFCKDLTTSPNEKQDSCLSPSRTTKGVKEGVALVISSVPNYAATSSATATPTIATADANPMFRLESNLHSDASPRMLFGINHEHGTLNLSGGSHFGTRFEVPALSSRFEVPALSSRFEVPELSSLVTAHPLRVMPYAPLEDLVSQTTTEQSHTFPPLVSMSHDSLVAPANSVFTSHDSVATITEFASQEMDCVPSPSKSQNFIPSDFISKSPPGETPPTEVGGSSGMDGAGACGLPPTPGGGLEEADDATRDAYAAALGGAAFFRNKTQKSQMDQPSGGSGIGITSSSPAGGSVGSAAGGDGGATLRSFAPQPAMKEPLRFGKESLCSNDTAAVCAELWTALSDPSNMVKMLFSNWSSIVTIVLGFDPFLPPFSSSSSPRPLSSVHLLDNFTTDLILNCSDHMIDHFVNAIIKQLNFATQGSSDLLLLVQEIDYADPEAVSRYLERGEVGVAFLVGRRFLNSVVRVLALEHSRIKNRFLEMQQARQLAASAQADDHDDMFYRRRAPPGGVASPNRKTSIATTVIAIITRFSWLGVYVLAQAAEGCASPVRLGVSKPLGASSVVADYQTGTRSYTGSNYVSRASTNRLASRQRQSMVRQLHVRTAKVTASSATKASGARGDNPRTDACPSPMLMPPNVRSGYRATALDFGHSGVPPPPTGVPLAVALSCHHWTACSSQRLFNTWSSLPMDGLFLRPQSLEGEACQMSSTRQVGACVNNQEESSDEELNVSMDDPTSGGRGDVEATPIHTRLMYPVDPTSPPYTTHIHNEVFLDLDSESSSDGGYHPHNHDYLEFGGTAGGGDRPEEDNLDTVYPFAWALDGRRIGENGVAATGRAESPNSITAPLSVFNTSHEPPVPLCNIPSIRFGAGFLARTFARLVKDLVDISSNITDDKVPEPSLQLHESVRAQLVRSSVLLLERTWSWASCVLDMAEEQLLQGQHFNVQRHVVSLRSGGGLLGTSGRSSHLRASRSFVGSTPGEYIISLLRSAHHEDRDCLPVIDLYGYEHVVYVLDGLLYTLTHWPKLLLDHAHSMPAHDDAKTAPTSSAHTRSCATLNSGEPHRQNRCSESNKRQKVEPKGPEKLNSIPTESGSMFFKRTESVIAPSDSSESSTEISNVQFFGVEGGASLALENPELVGPPNPWEKLGESFSCPLSEDLPLANRPHLLKPFAKKEALFGSGCGLFGDGVESGGGGSVHEGVSGSTGSGKDGHGKAKKGKKRKLQPDDVDSDLPSTMAWSPEYAHQRWHSSISVFAHIFLAEGPGNERENFLNARAGFASRMARFRHQVSQLFSASQMSRDWAGTVSGTLSIRVKRERLIQDSLNTFQQLTHFHYSNVRVKFDGEDGSGPGVNRGFFASLSYELKSNDMSKCPLNRLGLLFHEPGKQPEQSCLFAPHPFMPHLASSSARSNTIKSQRRDAFVSIGRFLGLCLWFHYTVPFMVCRHVAKVLLGRPLAWHDLAFYNADLYEGLRQMMLDAELGKKDDTEFVATYCSYFEAPLPGKFLEPVLVELIPGGSKIAVSASRVQEYVRLYSMFMMVGCVQEELNALKHGLNDVIPNDLLAGLTAEDFQLLLSGGSADITLARIQSIITFNHTHGGSRSVCDRFEKMFWRVVSHMNNTEKQQLLYFATGSAALPASIDTSNRGPSVAITLDVITVRNVNSLPVASTCSQRMCIPLYPSYHILKKKLLQAIQCQAYGLG